LLKGELKMDYSADAKEIIANVGGDDNINTLIHCMTRLRFTLKNEDKANTAELEKMGLVIKVMKAQGQYQIVIGNKVTDVFDAILGVFTTFSCRRWSRSCCRRT
jgi:Phosphotransferase system IIB components